MKNYFPIWYKKSKLALFTLDTIYLSTLFSSNEQNLAGTLANADAIASWKQRDCKARGYILSTIEVSQQRILIDCTSAYQMWQALSAQHLEQASNNLYDLQARFYQYQYEGNDMKTRIADIKAIAHHLGEVDKAIEERELITKIVCTRSPSSFSKLCVILETNICG